MFHLTPNEKKKADIWANAIFGCDYDDLEDDRQIMLVYTIKEKDPFFRPYYHPEEE